MNLFVTSEDPVECARSLDDKRLGKMLMETNQLLSFAIHYHWDSYYGDPISRYVGDGMLCAAGTGHMNHPCSVWVRQSIDNFTWAETHARALDAEWAYRFDSFHSSATRTRFIGAFTDCLPSGPLLPFQNSAKNDGLGLDFTWLPVPLSYREYLKARWPGDKRPTTWTRRGAPSWSQEQCE